MRRRDDHLTRLRDVTYLGSHPALTGQRKRIDLTFRVDRLDITASRRILATVEWRDVTRLAALDRAAAEHALTAAHVVLFGALALLAPGATKVSHLEVVDGSGTWLFAVPGLYPVELRAGLEPVRRRVGLGDAGGSPVGEVASGRQVDALRALDVLREQGIISEVEYAERRSAVLDDLG